VSDLEQQRNDFFALVGAFLNDDKQAVEMMLDWTRRAEDLLACSNAPE
jgi:hypothetical protein